MISRELTPQRREELVEKNRESWETVRYMDRYSEKHGEFPINPFALTTYQRLENITMGLTLRKARGPFVR
ncbi:MAG: hypothetical protein AAB573_04880 [Patescibacteria group bacterium]